MVKFGLLLLLTIAPLTTSEGQLSRARRAAACRCEPSGKPRKPRFLLPVAGIGFLPVAIAARDSQVPSVGLPSLIDIRDGDVPRSPIEGERALEVGALAPDTATALPTVMAFATITLGLGVFGLLPRRRGRRRRARINVGGGGARRGSWRLRTAHRRRIGGVLTAGGGLVLLLGAREYAEGAEAQHRAREEWRRESEGRPITGPRGGGDVPDAQAMRDVAAGGVGLAIPLPDRDRSRTAHRGMPVARLVIPAIDLDEIVIEGVGPTELNGGPGHYPGSVLPGEPGNSVVSAHRDRHFRRFGELQIGSRVRTETHARIVEWVITDRRVVSRDTPALFKEPDATLTLTTCWPIRYFGPAPDRLILVAHPVR